MGKLVKGAKWADEQFELGSRPTRETIIRWIEADEVPGKIIDGEPYVDADRFALSEPVKKPGITGIDLIAS